MFMGVIYILKFNLVDKIWVVDLVLRVDMLIRVYYYCCSWGNIY